MSIGFGFLEQLAGRSILDPDEGPPASLFEAVRNHLVLLLNTRRGAIPHLPDYGLPDLSDVYKGYPESLRYLGAEIKRTIERYEPRLVHLKVELVSSSAKYFEANFTVTGYLVNPDGTKSNVTYRTMITQGGNAHVGQ